MEETKVENKKRILNEKMQKQITKKDLIKFKNFIQEKLLPLYIIANIAYLLIGSYLFMADTITQSRFAQTQILLMLLNVIVIIVMLAKNKYKKNPIHMWLLAIFIISIISTFFARIPKIAIMGFQDRYEGVLAIAYYLSLAFLSTFVKEKDKKAIINCIITTGIIQCIYAICQVYDVPGIIATRKKVAQGFITNQNFFGTYMLLCLGYSLGAYIDEKKNIKKIIYVIESIVLLLGLLLCNTTSVIVGFILMLLYILIFCIKNKKILKLIVTIAIVTLVTSFTSNLGKTDVVKEIGKTAKEATEVAKGNVDDKFGSSRLYIWKNALKILPKYLFIGAGIDNFYYAFPGEPLVSTNGTVYFDKAHNEYLQILITQGIFGLISYLGLYLTTVKRGIKGSLKNKEICYILPILGYLIQAFFNISVIEVAPIFYIALGICKVEK